VSKVGDVVSAIRAGELVVIPTDTVYGLACDAYREESARALSELKRRELGQPIALVIASVDSLLDCIPELGEAIALLLALLPGPFTLVLPNPARRYPWLTGDRPDTIGVRVPDVDGRAAEILNAVGPIAATSANRHGERDPRRLEDVPPEILGQLGHKVQHALRAFTPEDDAALKAAARTFPKTDLYDVQQTLT